MSLFGATCTFTIDASPLEYGRMGNYPKGVMTVRLLGFLMLPFASALQNALQIVYEITQMEQEVDALGFTTDHEAVSITRGDGKAERDGPVASGLHVVWP